MALWDFDDDQGAERERRRKIEEEEERAKKAEKPKRRAKKVQCHSFELRQRNEDGLLHGANAQILMDGVPMKGVTRVTVEVGAKEIGKITIELYGRAHVLGSFSQVELVPKE